jgi:hypothetical protein
MIFILIPFLCLCRQIEFFYCIEEHVSYEIIEFSMSRKHLKDRKVTAFVRESNIREQRVILAPAHEKSLALWEFEAI